MKINNFKELKVWQKAMELTTFIYQLTAYFPKEERYGLTSQVQRCGVSIPSNIAEGCGRVSNKAFKNCISISMGSSYELETQVLLAFKLGYITEEKLEEFDKLIKPVQKMAFGLYNSLGDE